MPAPRELDPLRDLASLAGKMLRNRRKAKGLTQAGLGALIPLSQAMIAGIELGKEVPSAEAGKLLDDAVGGDGELAAMWHHVRKDLHTQATYPVWSHAYLTAEAEATRIQHFANIVPGVTQTEDYARSIITSAAPLFGGDIEDKVEARMERKIILDRDDPVWFWSILDESALYRVVGSHDVMCAQLTHLLDLAARPRITFRVLPYDRGMPGGVISIGALLLLSRPGKNEAVYWESGLNGAFLEVPREVEVYRSFYDHLDLDVLSPQASTDLIRKAREEHHARCEHH
ncbi:helix-turn-helix domain-containing protein [Streptomyces hiroshimensis]|uniref:Transcriptional regulator n=1 Tax=Streptomyces hiroshimensis TaxID=66424 RepID=A0ABQ2Y4W0_9ACTN|nr:helix-turn-helix transcriptional regulator [Streptomyces hiroshimensis]GGX62402.1 transcriptional regulator [Streptomyces hiroshimensis]